jgi:uncharacterized RDD family membrane protein YckC
MSDSDSSTEIILAKWKDRFLAWLIDFLIVSVISTSIIFASFGTLEFGENGFWGENMQYVPTSILFFVYWTVLEYKTGQTIGKKILNLKTTNMQGGKPRLKDVMISCLGKAFFLPLDVLFGWLITNEKRQRVFNRLGNTIIVKVKSVEGFSDITYTKD